MTNEELEKENERLYEELKKYPHTNNPHIETLREISDSLKKHPGKL